MSYAETTQQLQLEQIGIYIEYSANVLYLYESCILFSQEVEVIWKRKWTAPTWIYVFTRYGSALSVIFDLIPIFGPEVRSCIISQRIDDVLTVFQFLCFAWFSSLRVHALLDGQMIVAGLVLLLNLVPLATNLFNYATSTVVIDADLCTITSPWSENFALLLTLITRTCVIIGDVIVLVVTWSKTVHSYHEAQKLGIKAPLATMLFRDGTFYFIILLALNVLEVLQRNIASLSALNLSSAFLQVFTPIIVCRFIINLRQIKSPGSSWFSGGHTIDLHSIDIANTRESIIQLDMEEEDSEEDERPARDKSSDIPAAEKLNFAGGIAGYGSSRSSNSILPV